jgi:hypothetical protein
MFEDVKLVMTMMNGFSAIELAISVLTSLVWLVTSTPSISEMKLLLEMSGSTMYDG